jgi:hypothetical protein
MRNDVPGMPQRASTPYAVYLKWSAKLRRRPQIGLARSGGIAIDSEVLLAIDITEDIRRFSGRYECHSILDSDHRQRRSSFQLVRSIHVYMKKRRMIGLTYERAGGQRHRRLGGHRPTHFDIET